MTSWYDIVQLRLTCQACDSDMVMVGFNSFSKKLFLFNYIITKINDHSKTIKWNIKWTTIMYCTKQTLANIKK
jgi:hypothetical protein